MKTIQELESDLEVINAALRNMKIVGENASMEAYLERRTIRHALDIKTRLSDSSFSFDNVEELRDLLEVLIKYIALIDPETKKEQLNN